MTADTAEIDARTIQRTYQAVLWGSGALTAEKRTELGDLLRGHIQLLLPEVAVYEPRMRGEYQRTTVHIITRARRLLGKKDADVWDLAVQCRALLTLYLHPGPLEPAGDTVTESRS
ncbi:DUF6415 family natural product biosynthesis protein [Streptomyces sp. ME19-01-6]|uniref:DUF6415 family natural product biosynthesis protein n=1 Tax=Streptomyces sp. ME19-01-6 TaxID=3028686 RepID=UPI0029AAAC51|nr:DUF6415 family natural product biosynthesis protein [Streptomyces sp. ME19-01-6]MDX3232578.1 DUF6415 family natural product biosynthesis protein [Streptomyces sp. ME19-01-6]